MLIIFSLIQVGPAMQSLFCEQKGCIFSIDEEKMAEKTNTDEKKHKKDYSGLSSLLIVQSVKTNVAFHLAEKILPFPCLEKLTPPPNLC